MRHPCPAHSSPNEWTDVPPTARKDHHLPDAVPAEEKMPLFETIERLHHNYGLADPATIKGLDGFEQLLEIQEGNVQIRRAHVELQSLMRISYDVLCLKKKKKTTNKI